MGGFLTCFSRGNKKTIELLTYVMEIIPNQNWIGNQNESGGKGWFEQAILLVDLFISKVR